jgi:hypothetical protein
VAFGDQAIDGHDADGDQQQDHDESVDLVAGRVGDGLRAVDVPLTFDPLRCQLVDPREDDDQGEPQDQEAQDQVDPPLRNIERGEQYVGDLQQYPAGHEVENRYAENVPAL